MTCLNLGSTPLEGYRPQLPSPHSPASVLPSSKAASLHQTGVLVQSVGVATRGHRPKAVELCYKMYDILHICYTSVNLIVLCCCIYTQANHSHINRQVFGSIK